MSFLTEEVSQEAFCDCISHYEVSLASQDHAIPFQIGAHYLPNHVFLMPLTRHVLFPICKIVSFKTKYYSIYNIVFHCGFTEYNCWRD